MPSLREARLRHAAHYLSQVRDAIKDYPNRETDWEELENHLVQVRAVREWLRENGGDPAAKDLLISYGELAWELLDVTQMRLTAMLNSSREAGGDRALSEQIMRRLNDILLTQKSIQSALPQMFIDGDRNVAARNIVNSNIYTGDVHITLSDVTHHAQQVNDAGEDEGRDASVGSDDESSWSVSD